MSQSTLPTAQTETNEVLKAEILPAETTQAETTQAENQPATQPENLNVFKVWFLNGGTQIDFDVTFKEDLTHNKLIGTAAQSFLKLVANKSIILDANSPLEIKISWGNKNYNSNLKVKFAKPTLQQAAKALSTLAQTISIAHNELEADIYDKTLFTKKALNKIGHKPTVMSAILN